MSEYSNSELRDCIADRHWPTDAGARSVARVLARELQATRQARDELRARLAGLDVLPRALREDDEWAARCDGALAETDPSTTTT